MKSDKKELVELKEIIDKEFSVAESKPLVLKEEPDDLEKFKAYLSAKFGYMLDHSYDTLINTLYRIDVDERKLERLFSDNNRDEIPSQLAELVIERQLMKIRTRNKFSNKNIERR